MWAYRKSIEHATHGMRSARPSVQGAGDPREEARAQTQMKHEHGSGYVSQVRPIWQAKSKGVGHAEATWRDGGDEALDVAGPLALPARE